jgi:hypothetical protein
MKQFVITSNRFTGELLFKYDLNDTLVGFENRAGLSDVQYHSTMRNLPLNSSQLQEWAKAPGVKIVEVPLDLSFAEFWNKYAYKVGDKKRCEKIWDKLDDANKTKAIVAIQKYRRFCEVHNIPMVYPERYLSQERYSNDFK